MRGVHVDPIQLPFPPLISNHLVSRFPFQVFIFSCLCRLRFCHCYNSKLGKEKKIATLGGSMIFHQGSGRTVIVVIK